MSKLKTIWTGGYVVGSTYYIDRTVPGLGRHRVSTLCSTPEAALKHLRQFEEDPAKYIAWLQAGRPTVSGDSTRAPPFEEMVTGFIEHKAATTCAKYTRNVATAFVRWRKYLDTR